MSRAELLAIGVALVAVALTVLVGNSHALAWLMLAAGFCFIAYPLWQDWWYGTFRPSRLEIDDLTGDRYRKYMKNPKFKKWVDHVFPYDKDVEDPRANRR